MDRFDRQRLQEAEWRAAQAAQAAQKAQRLGWPEQAAKLRHDAHVEHELAADIRRAANWRDERQCQRPPV